MGCENRGTGLGVLTHCHTSKSNAVDDQNSEAPGCLGAEDVVSMSTLLSAFAKAVFSALAGGNSRTPWKKTEVT